MYPERRRRASTVAFATTSHPVALLCNGVSLVLRRLQAVFFQSLEHSLVRAIACDREINQRGRCAPLGWAPADHPVSIHQSYFFVLAPSLFLVLAIKLLRSCHKESQLPQPDRPGRPSEPSSAPSTTRSIEQPPAPHVAPFQDPLPAKGRPGGGTAKRPSRREIGQGKGRASGRAGVRVERQPDHQGLGHQRVHDRPGGPSNWWKRVLPSGVS